MRDARAAWLPFFDSPTVFLAASKAIVHKNELYLYVFNRPTEPKKYIDFKNDLKKSHTIVKGAY